MDLSEISRTVNVWAHFLNLEPPSLHTCTNSRQTYVLFTQINFIIIVIRFFTLPKISTISFQRKYPPLTNQYQSRLEINPRSTVSRATSYIPRYYHKFPAYCTTSCAPRHRFLTQQIPKVILLQRSAIKIQLSS